MRSAASWFFGVILCGGFTYLFYQFGKDFSPSEPTRHIERSESSMAKSEPEAQRRQEKLQLLTQTKQLEEKVATLGEEKRELETKLVEVKAEHAATVQQLKANKRLDTAIEDINLIPDDSATTNKIAAIARAIVETEGSDVRPLMKVTYRNDGIRLIVDANKLFQIENPDILSQTKLKRLDHLIRNLPSDYQVASITIFQPIELRQERLPHSRLKSVLSYLQSMSINSVEDIRVRFVNRDSIPMRSDLLIQLATEENSKIAGNVRAGKSLYSLADSDQQPAEDVR